MKQNTYIATVHEKSFEVKNFTVLRTLLMQLKQTAKVLQHLDKVQ